MVHFSAKVTNAVYIVIGFFGDGGLQ